MHFSTDEKVSSDFFVDDYNLKNDRAKMSGSKKVRLQSSDGEVFEVETDIIKLSNTIKTMLEDLGVEDEESEAEMVPLPNVNAAILKKIVDWCTYHKDDQLPSQDNNEISAWDTAFLNVDKKTLVELGKAARKLDIKDLAYTCLDKLGTLVPLEVDVGLNPRSDLAPNLSTESSRERRADRDKERNDDFAIDSLRYLNEAAASTSRDA